MTQFIACRFRPWDQRSYPYVNDGEPVAIGDFVEVPNKDGTKVVEVVSLPDRAPPFECKPIVGKVEQPADWPTAAA